MDRKQRIIYILKDTNAWWKNKDFSVQNYFERDILAEVEQYLQLPQIIALVGLRRTGKTTLMLKIIESALAKIPSSNVLYFSFDDFSEMDLEDLMEAYKEVFGTLDIKTGEFLFCFDEIQKLKDWQDKVKRLYDTHKNIKIILSGSESLFIRKGIKETLGGRIFEFRVTQLSFKEYLRFIGRQEFAENPALYKDELVNAFRHFIKINGFPEMARVDDATVIYKYLKETVVDKIVFKDIPRLFKAPNTALIGELLDIIIFSPGQIIDATKLASGLSLSRQVVSSYLDYLEKSFLVKKIYNFSKNLRKQKKSLKKYYPAIVYPQVVEEKFSFCFENSLIWQMDAGFFWRDAYQNEVDAVLVDKNRKILPVEIKTGDVDLKSINYFLKKFKLDNGVVVTLNKESSRGKVQLVPFYKFLLPNAGDKFC